MIKYAFDFEKEKEVSILNDPEYLGNYTKENYSAIILKERKMHQLSSFFMDVGLIAMYVECQFTELQKSINGTSY